MKHFWYFTYRLLRINERLIHPGVIFLDDFTFKGLNLKFRDICGNMDKDGRRLAEITYEGDIPPEEIEQIVGEALAPYSYHKKTIEKAIDFVKYALETEDVLLDEEGRIQTPPRKPPENFKGFPPDKKSEQ